MKKSTSLSNQSSTDEISAFLKKTKSLSNTQRSKEGRLFIALDATASRQPTWDMACQIQGEMFLAVSSVGALSVKLGYFGGFNHFKVSPWVTNSADLLKLMSSVRCEAGRTQIKRVLQYALDQSAHQVIDALIFIGDSMEENPDILADLAGQLGLKGVPIFIFHEGGDVKAATTFKHLCQVSNGAYCRFDSHSADQLKQLLAAVASYVSGGRQALIDYARQHKVAALLSKQIK